MSQTLNLDALIDSRGSNTLFCGMILAEFADKADRPDFLHLIFVTLSTLKKVIVAIKYYAVNIATALYRHVLYLESEPEPHGY